MANSVSTDERLPRSPLTLRAEDTALLMVDMQERLLSPVLRAARVTWNCRRLLDGAKSLGVPAAATEQNPSKLGGTAAILAERLQDSARAKMAFSCGEIGDLFAGWLREGRHRVLVCGIETHVCVLQTALDLLAAGYEVHVTADATSARYEVDHDMALRRLDSAGAVITTTETALFELCGAAGTDAFRQISALAKERAPD